MIGGSEIGYAGDLAATPAAERMMGDGVFMHTYTNNIDWTRRASVLALSF